MFECLLSNLLVVPFHEAPLSPSFLCCVLGELFKAQPSFVPRLFAQMMQLLFSSRLHELSEESRHRVADFFALHLSNFALMWPWCQWKQVLEQPDLHLQRLFVQHTIQRLCLLSYSDRVRQTFHLAAWLSIIPCAPTPAFKYNEKNTQGTVNEASLSSPTPFHSRMYCGYACYFRVEEAQRWCILLPFRTACFSSSHSSKC